MSPRTARRGWRTANPTARRAAGSDIRSGRKTRGRSARRPGGAALAADSPAARRARQGADSCGARRGSARRPAVPAQSLGGVDPSPGACTADSVCRGADDRRDSVNRGKTEWSHGGWGRSTGGEYLGHQAGLRLSSPCTVSPNLAAAFNRPVPRTQRRRGGRSRRRARRGRSGAGHTGRGYSCPMVPPPPGLRHALPAALTSGFNHKLRAGLLPSETRSHSVAKPANDNRPGELTGDVVLAISTYLTDV
jgi:hypothetical protein